MWVRRTMVALPIALVLTPCASAGAWPASSGGCGHAVVVALPGVTWQDVHGFSPVHILSAARLGAVGVMSVRTIKSLTTPADAFATMGAGARVEGGAPPRATIPSTATALNSRSLAQKDVSVGSIDELDALARDAGYEARPGALASSLSPLPVIAVGNADLGEPPPVVSGAGRWALLGAMNAQGTLQTSFTGRGLLRRDRTAPFGVRTDAGALETALDRALSQPCSTVIVDPGDLDRADAFAGATADPQTAVRRRALEAADALVGFIQSRLGKPDLLLIVTTTSPSWAGDPHLGVAIADGPGYLPGSSLVSASTRRAPNVTLPDIAPTILGFQGRSVAGAMDGRPMTSTAAVARDRIADAIALDRESVYIDSLKVRIDAGYISFQILVYLVASVLLILGQSRGVSYLEGETGRIIAIISLALVAFPSAVYLAGSAEAYRIGTLLYALLLVGIDAVLVIAACLVVHPWLDRLLALSLFTIALVFVNLSLGAPLELNTVFGYSPIVAGRFAGLGNTGFAVLGGAVVIGAALIAQRRPRSSSTYALIVLLFALAIVFDGAPQLGSDIGGIIAFVPALGVTAFLLMDVRPRPAAVLAIVIAAFVVVGVFLAVDLSRPPQDQTHLARLFEAVRARGIHELTDTIARKAEANLKIFRTTLFTYLFPPALAAMAFLVLRPRGRWRRLARAYPKVRAGLIGGIVLGVLGAAVNDSGIVIPAMMLSFFVPLAFLVHLEIEREDHESPASGAAETAR